MLSKWLTSASALVLCLATSASAQQQIPARKVLGPVKDAGIYHVVSGTWTRGSGSTANLGPDIIYRNDHDSGYFGTGWESAQGIDEGILPGPGNPLSGSQDVYKINGLSFSYCAQGAGPGITWELELYESYVACTDPDFAPCCCLSVWTLSTGNLPANSSCWLVTFDLAGGAEVCMEADGGPCWPGYDGGGIGIDGYGFGQRWLNGGIPAGPVLAGNPNWAPRGDGTCYQPNLTCAAGATGLGEQDLFGIGTNTLGGMGNGCFWFGGYKNKNGCGLPSQTPTASMNHTLYTDCNETCVDCESVSCDDAMDPNNFADASVNDDCNGSDGSLIVHLSQATPNKFTYLLIGTNAGQVVNPPGALGSLCVSGQIGRYAKDIGKIGAGGSASLDIMNANTGGGGGSVPNIGGNIIGGTWNAQWWYRFDSSSTGSRFSSLVTFGPVL